MLDFLATIKGLLDAIRSGDYTLIGKAAGEFLKAVGEVLTSLFSGMQAVDPGTAAEIHAACLELQAALNEPTPKAAPFGKVDWSKLFAVIMQVLPLILDLFKQDGPVIKPV